MFSVLMEDILRAFAAASRDGRINADDKLVLDTLFISVRQAILKCEKEASKRQ